MLIRALACQRTLRHGCRGVSRFILIAKELAFNHSLVDDPTRNQPLAALLTPLVAQQLEVMARFFDVLLADLSFSSESEAMAVAYVQFDRASVRSQLGQFSELRVLELETVYQNILHRRTASELGQQLTRSLLAQALGHPEDLPKNLVEPAWPSLPDDLPTVDELVSKAAEGQAVHALGQDRSPSERALIQLELRQQILELLLRLKGLVAAERSIRTESAWRDMKLDESRTLYDQEVTADLGYSMSQQTQTRVSGKAGGLLSGFDLGRVERTGRSAPLGANASGSKMMHRGVIALLLLMFVPAAQAVVELKGWLEWVHEVEMRVLESGVVNEVVVSVGQHVKKGDLLLRMDQREAKANLLEARARVARARVEGEQAQRELARSHELFDRGLIAIEELKDAELKQVAAVAEEEAAKAVEASRVVALERTELLAPFNGIVVARHAWNGAVIYKTLQQEPLIVIAPDDRMLARALVTANVLRGVKPGQAAKVTVNGTVREGQVYSLGVQSVRVELEGAVYYLDIIFDQRINELLRPAETVRILIP